MDVNDMWNQALQLFDREHLSPADMQRAVAALNALQREWAVPPFPFTPIFGEMTADEFKRAWGDD